MKSAAEFLATGNKFQLGFLETEKPHPKTMRLSDLAVSNLTLAISVLADVDYDALEKLKSHADEILTLKKAIQKTFTGGGRVFLCGCGATGRLSLLLESLYRESCKDAKFDDRVVAFMAGGDVALVHSLEGFEDYPDYGKRHLLQLGFSNNDMLIAITEGGETPYVIGAVEAAAELSRDQHRPYFVYCNPDNILKEHVERSRKVLENSKILKINLTVGPMAITGSTRMQASTVLQLAVGFALLQVEHFKNESQADHESEIDKSHIISQLTWLQKYMRDQAVNFLSPFIEQESFEYLNNKYILYLVKDYALTVFTDTTERAPTFSLTPFSHREAHKLLALQPSKCFIQIAGANSPSEAWELMLKRKPRSLDWRDIDERTNSHYLEQFDFANGAMKFRNWLTQGAEHSEFQIFREIDSKNESKKLVWEFKGVRRNVELPNQKTFQMTGSQSLLFENTLLKMLINIQSTLVMGRLGRYKRNMMTWVFPTNGKLIDRATRYIKTLLNEDGIEIKYDDVVNALFETKAKIDGNESIVLATYEELKRVSRV
ncbi:MAG: SIS domain-containing protein [Bdellovibrionales bacterium]